MASKNLTKIIFYFYFGSLVWIILFKMQMPFSNVGQIRSVNLIPLAGSVAVNGRIYVREIVENVLIFIPFGIFSGMLLQSDHRIRLLAPSFFTSLMLEILQFVFAAGVTDITDLLANTGGGLIGIAVFEIFSGIWKEKVYVALNWMLLLGASGMMFLIGMLLIVNF